MARTRNIKPSFFKNEDLSECPFEARLLFAGLWTLADREGRLEYRPKRIKVELFPFDAVEIPELAVKLHDKKFIVMYEVDGASYIQVLGFLKHQRPHPKEPQSEFPQVPEGYDSCAKAVEKNGEPRKETASCAFPSSNPLILKSLPESRPSLPAHLDNQAFQDVLGAWLEYKRERGERYKPTGMKRLVSACSERAKQFGVPAVCDAMNRAMANGSQGWNFSNSFSKQGKAAPDDHKCEALTELEGKAYNRGWDPNGAETAEEWMAKNGK